jgi:hypothetical protein
MAEILFRKKSTKKINFFILYDSQRNRTVARFAIIRNNSSTFVNVEFKQSWL